MGRGEVPWRFSSLGDDSVDSIRLLERNGQFIIGIESAIRQGTGFGAGSGFPESVSGARLRRGDSGTGKAPDRDSARSVKSDRRDENESREREPLPAFKDV